MRNNLLAPIVACSIACCVAVPANAQNAMSGFAGGWALESASGVRLPPGDCSPQSVNRFQLSVGRLVWTPPSVRRMPSLTLTVTTPFWQLAMPGSSVVQVQDRSGTQGEIRIQGNRQVHAYSNGARLSFVRC